MALVKPFTISDMDGNAHIFNSDRPSIICFVKEDCPTCRVALPVISALFEVFSAYYDFYIT